MKQHSYAFETVRAAVIFVNEYLLKIVIKPSNHLFGKAMLIKILILDLRKVVFLYGGILRENYWDPKIRFQKNIYEKIRRLIYIFMTTAELLS